MYFYSVIHFKFFKKQLKILIVFVPDDETQHMEPIEALQGVILKINGCRIHFFIVKINHRAPKNKQF